MTHGCYGRITRIFFALAEFPWESSMHRRACPGEAACLGGAASLGALKSDMWYREISNRGG
jgi:hypothetical protein